MSGQVLGFVRSPHQVVFELLPWFVNGTLEAAEQASVERHLQECAACRREVEWLRQLSSAYAESEPAVDCERALARIAPQLHPNDADRTRAPWSSRLRAALAGNVGWMRFAVAMQLGVIVALGWALAVRGAADYRGLASAPPRNSGKIIVVFDPAARESEVRGLLRAAGARVVDGPTAASGYVLEVTGDNSAVAAALARLRAAPAVMLAEPLQGERAP
ncbi:MAG TPA: zf-HC2 domain-containing protein [Burkholderiaceae bacterium]|nr:zf-HC2 domain-containing protein [Burkholderiaceae bacterium]